MNSEPQVGMPRNRRFARHACPAAPARWLRHAAPAAYLLPAALLYGTFVIWPFVRVGILSLERWDGYSAPAFDGLDNFALLWTDPGISAELEHSLIWLLVTLTLPAALGLALALLLRSVPPEIRAPLRGLLLLPLLVPTVLTAVAWRLFYNPLSGPLTSLLRFIGLGSLAGDWLGDPRLALPALLVAACWGSFGLSMIICEAGLAQIRDDVQASARLDGAGPLALFWATTMPALRGVLPLAVVAGSFSAIPSYDLVSLLTNGGPGYATTTLALDSFGRAFGGNGQVGVGAALASLQAITGVILAAAALLIARGLAPREIALDETHAPRRRTAQTLAGTGILIGLMLLLLSPLVWLFILAVRPAGAGSGWAALTSNVTQVWDQGFGSAAATSICTALVVSAAATVIALMAGFALATSRSPALKAGAAALLALGLFQPMSVLIIPLFDVVRSFGLLNTLPGVMGPEIARALAVGILLVWVGICHVPGAVLDAAAVDGASSWHLLTQMVLPLVRPLLLVTATWAFLLSWNDYLMPSVVLAGGDTQTVPLALAHFAGRADTEYGLLATGALSALLPIALLYAPVYRGLARGFLWLAI